MKTTVQFVPVTDKEKESFTAYGMNAEAYLSDTHIKTVVTDDFGHTGKLFIKDADMDMFGQDYIRANVSLQYNKYFNNYIVTLDVNPFYNDIKRFPPKTITVRKVDVDPIDGAEIYKSDTNKYYRRLAVSKENFARWTSAAKHDDEYEDIAEIRANITFRCGNETEKVTFYNWNGNAAHSDTFNPDFGKEDAT